MKLMKMKVTLASTVNPASVTCEHRAASRILKANKHEHCLEGWAAGFLWLIIII